MKKRILSLTLALCMALTLLPLHALAADTSGGFADVTDKATAQNVEVLRLLGVINGDENGRFRPDDRLTRAEFCKMAIVLQGREDQVGRYRTRTLFPDVRPSHWASGYINLASTPTGEKQPGLMHGFPDGSFQPSKQISYAEAVTVLMRVLGYTDADAGGVWPDGYIQLGASSGLTAGLSIASGDAITRAQAAKLFVGALRAEKAGGGTIKTLGDEVLLLSIDMTKGVMRTTDGKSAPKETEMAKPMLSTVLNGLRGRIILNDEKKALSFLPSITGTASGGYAVTEDAALIITNDGSNIGFSALTGNAKNYTIVRNGIKIGTKELKKNDVATYSAQTNTVLVCDTRVSVYYESAMPNPQEPIAVTVLGGTVFNVVSSAKQGIAAFRPGQRMTLMLTADGRVAGAVSAEDITVPPNAVGYVDGSGKITMFCGSILLELGCKNADMAGQVVGIVQLDAKQIVLSKKTSVVSGDLDVPERKLGATKLSADAMIISDGVLISLSDFDKDRVEARHIVYARRNSADEVDLLVLGGTSGELIGRVKRYSVFSYQDEFGVDRYVEVMSLINPSGETKPSRFLYNVETGDFAVTKVNSEDNFYDFMVLNKLLNVDPAAWIGTSVVNYGGRSYTIADDVMCYNRDTGGWFSSLKEALEYGGTVNLYTLDGVVRALDIGA